MPMKAPQRFEAFASGVCDIYKPGEDGTEQKEYHLRYVDRVVGIKRFFEAAAAQVEISAVIRVPQRLEISTNYIVQISGKRYRIKQVQHLSDTLPPVSDLSLCQIFVDAWEGER